MGTYGVTHIKKNNKIIPFSDSYDGYWSGMGQANLIGLKHIPLTVLATLFDNFTARKALSQEEANVFEEPDNQSRSGVSQRQISNFITQVALDTNNNLDAIDWAKNSVLGDISTSTLGVVPLLYMNIHPHYGYNYDYADYVIDLDNKVFTFTSTDLSISLDAIQKTNELNIAYLFENDFSLINPSHLPNEFEGIKDYIYENDNNVDSIQKMQQVIEEVFSIPVEKIQAYFEKKEKEREQYIAQDKASLLTEDNFEDDDLSYSYSLHTAEVSSGQLRNILFFLQQKAKQPGYEFILDCAEWGLDQNYIQGGIRLKSPSDNQQYEKFSEIMLTLEYALKQRFNIMSGAGSGFGLSPDLEENLTIHKSIFSFSELKSMLSDNDFSLVMNEGLPYLAYHTYLDEAIAHIVSQNGKTNSPVFWVFVALLSQNKELFDVVYDKAKEQLPTFDTNDQTRIKQLYLTSYYDGILLSDVVQNSTTFVEDIKSTTFFSDCVELLNEIEKKSLLS